MPFDSETGLDKPSWHLQSRRRAENSSVADTTCSQAAGVSTGLRSGRHTSTLTEICFSDYSGRTASDTARSQMATASVRQKKLIQTPSHTEEFSAIGLIGGRRHFAEQTRTVHPEGKRTFQVPDPKPPHPSGIRRTHQTAPSLSNPNSLAPPASTVRAEGKRAYPRADAGYRIYVPQELPVPTRTPGVRVIADEAGVPLRSHIKPVAWPQWPGYPPERDAKTGAKVDYALSKHEHGGFRSMPREHPDVAASRQNRKIASDQSCANQQMRCRQAGIYFY